jgi:hypothetical protein
MVVQVGGIGLEVNAEMTGVVTEQRRTAAQDKQQGDGKTDVHGDSSKSVRLHGTRRVTSH